MGIIGKTLWVNSNHKQPVNSNHKQPTYQQSGNRYVKACVGLLAIAAGSKVVKAEDQSVMAFCDKPVGANYDKCFADISLTSIDPRLTILKSEVNTHISQLKTLYTDLVDLCLPTTKQANKDAATAQGSKIYADELCGDPLTKLGALNGEIDLPPLRWNSTQAQILSLCENFKEATLTFSDASGQYYSHQNSARDNCQSLIDFNNGVTSTDKEDTIFIDPRVINALKFLVDKNDANGDQMSTENRSIQCFSWLLLLTGACVTIFIAVKSCLFVKSRSTCSRQDNVPHGDQNSVSDVEADDDGTRGEA